MLRGNRICWKHSSSSFEIWTWALPLPWNTKFSMSVEVAKSELALESAAEMLLFKSVLMVKVLHILPFEMTLLGSICQAMFLGITRGRVVDLSRTSQNTKKGFTDNYWMTRLVKPSVLYFMRA